MNRFYNFFLVFIRRFSACIFRFGENIKKNYKFDYLFDFTSFFFTFLFWIVFFWKSVCLQFAGGKRPESSKQWKSSDFGPNTNFRFRQINFETPKETLHPNENHRCNNQISRYRFDRIRIDSKNPEFWLTNQRFQIERYNYGR